METALIRSQSQQPTGVCGKWQERLTAMFSRGIVVSQQWPWPRQVPDGGGGRKIRLRISSTSSTESAARLTTRHFSHASIALPAATVPEGQVCSPTQPESNQSDSGQQQEVTHSSQDISTPVVEEGLSTEAERETRQPRREKMNGHRPGVSWPGAAEGRLWENVKSDLVSILGQLKGTAESKLEKMGDIIYSYGKERFGIIEKRAKRQQEVVKSRRQKEIDKLIKERRQLKKQWRKATVVEKEGIYCLQAEVRGRLVMLRRAENIRKNRKRKSRARLAFYKDPFQFVKSLFVMQKSGSLLEPKQKLEEYLEGSKDPVVRKVAPTVKAGRKWNPEQAVKQAQVALRHRDIMGHVQHGRGGLGLDISKPLWSKASAGERRKMVVEEMHRQEETVRCTKAVSQARQGQWVNWEGVEKKQIRWKDLWGMEAGRIRFMLGATYDVLPSPKNLSQWFGEDEKCTLCSCVGSLRHILSGCKLSLTQGRYTWRHNQVLKCLAAAIEDKRREVNSLAASKDGKQINFVRQGGQPRSTKARCKTGSLITGAGWELKVDLGQQMAVPSHIVSTRLRPDLLFWSDREKAVFLVELTIPWEDRVEEANELKRAKYTEIAEEAAQRGWSVRLRPIEIGARGFVARSAISLLSELGIRGRSLRQVVSSMSLAAERASEWLWVRRSSTSWGKISGFDPEDLTVDVGYWFKGSTNRKGYLAEFCDFHGSKYMEMLLHISVLWLSLERCKTRIMRQYGPLTGYFKYVAYFIDSSTDEKQPMFRRLVDAFSNPLTEVYLLFFQATLPKVLHT
ncbi:hypothetical protein N1851_015879 [Merluccius polli]|uniref:Reverse transcriptase n=1 Tax=Merluccius polli TaxID=89951 RepID=A0AA47MSB1_MERPO|nr:hypothetical protein N1851_015879 [Merluccius polli]